MGRYWFYLMVAGAYYAMLGWSWFVLTRLQRQPTPGFRRRLAGWMVVLALPSLWLTFRMDRVIEATTVPASFATMILLIVAFGFTVVTGLGYAGFWGARLWALLRGIQMPAKALTATAVVATEAKPTETGLAAATPVEVLTPAKYLPVAEGAPATTPVTATAPVSAPVTATVTTLAATARWVPPMGAPAEWVHLSRRRWLQGACYGYLGAMSLTAVGAAWTHAVGLTVKRVQIVCPRLPKAFQGYRIVQVADIHSGTYMDLRQMQAVREAVDQLRPDMIVFTGDQVDRRPHEIEPFLSAFNGLAAPDGVYGILGNHDYIAGGRTVQETLSANGMPILVNRGLPVRRGEQSLWLGGLDDLWHGVPDLNAAFAGAGPEAFRICLAHNPNCWDFIAPTGVDLTLSGHTHGGQINFVADSLSPARLLSKYVQGLYEREQARLFVSVGVGYVGIPVRIGVPAEIVEITLE